MNGTSLWKIIVCSIISLIAAALTYVNIKDFLPFPAVIAVIIFVLVYAGMTHIVE